MFKTTVQLGTAFRTGESVPVSGVYVSIGHTDGTHCSATPAERMVPLSRGEVFPPHRSCRAGVVWQLASYA